MDANEVIESYVRDVASCLPRRKRNDVAFELRALLADELAAKAHAEGRAPDKRMAMDLLKGFGRPADAAARYHPRAAVIDPVDTHSFLVWALGGVVTVSVFAMLNPPGKVDQSDLVLKWLGILVVVFALKGWWAGWRRRRAPGEMRWKPKRVQDPRHSNPLVSITLGILTLIPFFMYAMPRRFVEVAFLHAIPTGGLALDAQFQDSALRVATILALGLQTAVYVWAALDGGWRRATRWVSILAILSIGVLAGDHVGLARQGLVFVSPRANETAAPIFGAVAAMMVLSAFYEMYREWARISPAPMLAPGRA